MSQPHDPHGPPGEDASGNVFVRFQKRFERSEATSNRAKEIADAAEMRHTDPGAAGNEQDTDRQRGVNSS